MVVFDRASEAATWQAWRCDRVRSHGRRGSRPKSGVPTSARHIGAVSAVIGAVNAVTGTVSAVIGTVIAKTGAVTAVIGTVSSVMIGDVTHRVQRPAPRLH